MTLFPNNADLPCPLSKPTLFWRVNRSFSQQEFNAVLAKNIKDYWKSVGGLYVRVRETVIPLKGRCGLPTNKITVLRSNLKNGLPPKRKVA